jgi:glutamate/tyrosine decarboxylase-like PLP-dependent enzyme
MYSADTVAVPAAGEPLDRDLLDDDFLRPDEANVHRLAERVAHFAEHVSCRRGSRPALLTSVAPFSYGQMLERAGLPFASQSREAAAEASLEAFEGVWRPHHPDMMFNLTPSPMLDTVALAAVTALYNPNGIWDLTSGKFVLLEQRVLHALGRLAGWPGPVSGTFASGGKATFLYAIKQGLNRCDPWVNDRGLDGSYAVVCSERVHYSVESVCAFLGLGRDACHRVPADASGAVDVTKLTKCVRDLAASGTRLAAVILAGGAIIDPMPDPVGDVRRALDDLGLPYKPLVHLDAVVTWPWLALLDPRTPPASAGVRPEVQRRAWALAERLGAIRQADSFGVDFHKTGLSPYGSSCFVTRHPLEFRRMVVSAGETLGVEEGYGDLQVYGRTLENSRQCTGIITAHYVLHRLGVRGLQQYVHRLLTMADDLRGVLTLEHPSLGEVLNPGSLGGDVMLRLRLGTPGVPGSATGPRREAYRRLANRFRNWTVTSAYCRDHPVPLLGFVPEYEPGLPAWLLHPNSLYTTRRGQTAAMTQLGLAVSAFLREDTADGHDTGFGRSRPLPPR